MNHAPRNNDDNLHIATGVKTAALVAVLALIVMIADQSLVVPAESPEIGASSSIAPYEATSLSADGHGSAATAKATATQDSGAGKRAAAPTMGLYPEPAADAVRDPDGHPASF